MDPRHLFVDERLTGACVFCGGPPDTRDHCPSKVLLDDPLPLNLPVVEACNLCNNSFSLDEQYLACVVEAVLCGSVEQQSLRREKVKSVFAKNAALAARINMGKRLNESGATVWDIEDKRILNVVVKLARGHVAYELSVPHLEEPDEVVFVPLLSMSEEYRTQYEVPEADTVQPWPEIGSRAFIRAANWPGELSGDWQVLQEGRYRYLVSQTCGDFVQMVLSEYLACRVVWA